MFKHPHDLIIISIRWRANDRSDRRLIHGDIISMIFSLFLHENSDLHFPAIVI